MARKKVAKAEKVRFSIKTAEAKEVKLAGDFNNWNANSGKLKKSRGNIWIKDVLLKPGRYEYKFVIDGNWISDPDNDSRSWNSFGSENSVVEI